MAFQNTGFQNTAFQVAEDAPAAPEFGWFRGFPGPRSSKILFYMAMVSVVTIAAPASPTNAVTIDGPRVNFPRTLYYQAKIAPPPRPTVVVGDVTPDQWLQAWKAPTRYLIELPGGQPFVPKEAVLENTVTPDKWLLPFPTAAKKTWPPLSVSDLRQFAVPGERLGVEWLTPFGRPLGLASRPYQQAPFVYSPAAAVSNLTTTLEWLRPWQGPPSYQPPFYTPQIFGYPYVAASNLTTTLEWLPRWQGPPSYSPPTIAASPFVPKEAVLENTVTPEKWLVRWAKAVPVPKPVPTQPAFGYPYESLAIAVPYEQWWQQPLSTAVDRPQVHNKPYQPFVPRAAVLENTVTPDKWLYRFQKAAPHGWPRYAAVTVPVFPYEAAPVVGPDKWLQRWQGPPSYQPPWIAASPFVPREAVLENTVTAEKWTFRWQQAVPHGWPTHTQPFFGYPYVDLFFTGGPADESERVACVHANSREASPPLLLRVATVPLQRRRVSSNDYRDRPCHDT